MPAVSDVTVDAAGAVGDDSGEGPEQDAGPTAAPVDTRDAGSDLPVTNDPGAEPWQLVPREDVAEQCGLDPDLLDEADALLNRRWAVVRYGKLCHEFYPVGESVDTVTEVFSGTKTLGAVVTGRVIHETVS